MGTLSCRLALLGLLALSLGAGGACLLKADGDRFDTWGLPRDLPTRQRQLQTLQLPPPVDSIDWLTDGLEVLLIPGTNISDLRDLPATLTTLDISFTQVTSLRGLPEGLRELDLESAPVQPPLVHVPDGLRKLTVSGDRLTSASGLPQGLTELRLVATAIRMVSGLPPRLRQLSLEGPSFERIDTLPPDLKSLVVRGTNIKALRGLPESLQTLVLEGNQRLGLDELPPFLTHLRIDRGPTTQLEGPYIGRLEGPLNALGREARWPKPLTVLYLEVGIHSNAEIPALPASLRALALLQSRTLPEFPSLIENLSLEGFQGTEIPEVLDSARNLRQLNLAWSKIQNIENMPPTVVDLDLSATPVTTLSKLPAGLVSLRFRHANLEQIGNELLRLTKLQNLDLSGSRTLSRIGTLPPSLVSLNLSGSPLTELPELPASLRVLDISNTQIRGEIPKLPSKLESLTLSRGQIQSLSRLPSKVRKLYFVDTASPTS